MDNGSGKKSRNPRNPRPRKRKEPSKTKTPTDVKGTTTATASKRTRKKGRFRSTRYINGKKAGLIDLNAKGFRGIIPANTTTLVVLKDINGTMVNITSENTARSRCDLPELSLSRGSQTKFLMDAAKKLGMPLPTRIFVCVLRQKGCYGVEFFNKVSKRNTKVFFTETPELEFVPYAML